MNYTPEQRAAIETTGLHLCVDAGAGSGKTRVLVDRVIHLIEDKHADLGEIVAITFTEKAASEMKERLRRACREKATVADSQAMSYWRGVERQIDGARISTIHAFCGNLLRENALACGLDPDFAILTDAESAMLRYESVTETIHGLLEAGSVNAHALAVEIGPVALIRTIQKLLAQSLMMDRALERQPLDDVERLLAHWEAEAESENRRRLRAFGSQAMTRKLEARLRSYEGRCTKETDGRETFRRFVLAAFEHIRKLDDAGAIETELRSITEYTIPHTRASHWSSPQEFDELKLLQTRVKALADDALPLVADPETERAAAELTRAFADVYRKCAEAYAEAKRARAALGFDDLIGTALSVLDTNAAVPEGTLRGTKHFLIDEFQDTDGVQFAIARLLQKSGDGPGAELFIVGDPKQSIYNFRGAEAEIFAGARQASEKVICLDRNFRSLPDTLSFINNFFQTSGLMEYGNIDFVPLIPHRALAGQPRIEFLIPEKVEGAKAPDGRRLEADLIASRLARMCSGGSAVEIYDERLKAARPASFGDAAILFRSTTDRYIYEESLRRKGVPFDVVAGAGFYERQEISDFVNLLRTASDPYDELALLGFLRSPIGALSDESLMRLCMDQGLAQAFQSSVALEDPAQQSRIARARRLVAEIRGRSGHPLSGLLRHALTLTGYEAMLLGQYHGVQKASNLRKLVDQAGEFSRTRLPRLRPFLRYLSDAASHEVREGDAALHAGGGGAVTLMTIHKAKGLEFPIVVLADASRKKHGSDNWGRVHAHRRRGLAVSVTGASGETVKPRMAEMIARDREAEDEAEQARVLYVALTRARDWLVISGAESGGVTWLNHFDEAYGVCSRGHAEVFNGEGWGASVVRRDDDGDGIPAPMQPEIQLGDRRYWDRRIRPIHPGGQGRAVYAVSELLDRCHGVAMGEAEGRVPAAADRAFVREGGALARGGLVHRLFEKWKFQTAAPIDEVVGEAFPYAGDRDALKADLITIADRFASSGMLDRLRRAGRIDREIPFLLNLRTAMVSGAIDALVDDVLLIDYKTGQRRPALEARYETQLRLYAAAVSRLRGTDVREAILYYADTGETIAVDVGLSAVDDAILRAASHTGGARSETHAAG